MKTTDDPFAHILPNVHEGVRKSKLMLMLYDRLAELPPASFPFAGEFERLRNIVSPQIEDTRILFPEFTPHNEELHIVKLFQLADKLFGNIYSHLRSVELFLLGCALYAHDWGMAVGTKEQKYLLHGAKLEDKDDSFIPLPDEADRLKAFALSAGLRPTATESTPKLSTDQLRLYVRLTHARRSGARVRAHFHEHPALGQALAHLCEGHWHDFATLDDLARFPREYEVIGETAHLLALALQVRLIDLFHITDDRTPYALWRFVSPTDNKSAEEWRKHRALHGITCIDFPPGRAIKIQGFTEDEEVWAGLQDLHRYCEDQVKRTLDLSARHVSERYGLNYVKLEWAVTTGNLRPVQFAFNFDRTAMFRILSDDIYDGDRYVFLRELLQNAIDAIRTRRFKHEDHRDQKQNKRKQIGPTFDTTIYFCAEHKTNGDIHITCRDYGIGMDEHIIRNYFSVAGISYYRSAEFQNMRLGFEPISRFGIGILSCFMVADSIQVKTYRDPDCGPPMAQSDLKLPGAEAHRARRLCLKVPAVDRQFVVKDTEDSFEVGTEVSLDVLSRKVFKNNIETDATKPDDAVPCHRPQDFERALEITEYLCFIAGFVEFPIHVEERWPGQEKPRLTLILHPDCDPEKESKDFDPIPVVHQLCRDYPWEVVTASESMQTVQKHMTSRRFELKELLGEEGYEGWVNFPSPIDVDFCAPENTVFNSGGSPSISLRRYTSNGREEDIAYWRTENFSSQTNLTEELFSIYRDGIRLSDVYLGSDSSIKNWCDQDMFDVLPTPQVLVNLKSSFFSSPNISRTSLKSGGEKWDLSIRNAVTGNLANNEIQQALSLSPEDRLYQLGWLKAIFRLSEDELNRMVPDNKKVCIFLGSPNNLYFRERHEITGEVNIFPSIFNDVADNIIKNHRFHDGETIDFCWEGPDSILQTGFRYGSGESIPLNNAIMLSSLWSSTRPKYIQFLEPPRGGNYIDYQVAGELVERIPKSFLIPNYLEVARHKKLGIIDDIPYKDTLNAVIANPVNLDSAHLIEFQRALGMQIPLPFAKPFQSYVGIEIMESWLTHSSWVFNSNTEVGATISRCLAACILAFLEQRLSYSATDEIKKLLSYRGWIKIQTNSLDSFVSRLFAFVERERLIEGFHAPEIPNKILTVPKLSTDSDNLSMNKISPYLENPGRCGRIITVWPLPNLEEPTDSGT